MSNNNAEFTELGRVEISDKKSLVVSSVFKDGAFIGININSYITTPRYTGYTKGVFVQGDKIADVIKLINQKVE